MAIILNYFFCDKFDNIAFIAFPKLWQEIKTFQQCETKVVNIQKAFWMLKEKYIFLWLKKKTLSVLEIPRNLRYLGLRWHWNMYDFLLKNWCYNIIPQKKKKKQHRRKESEQATESLIDNHSRLRELSWGIFIYKKKITAQTDLPDKILWGVKQRSEARRVMKKFDLATFTFSSDLFVENAYLFSTTHWLDVLHSCDLNRNHKSLN